MLSSHNTVAVEFGGIKGNLLYLGNGAHGVGLARGLSLQPSEEELLKQGGLRPCWYHLDLSRGEILRKCSLKKRG